MNLKLSNRLRLCFLSGIAWGLIVHIYMFTNKLPNWDDLSFYGNAGFTLTSGRWLLDYLNGFSSIWSLPWVNGFWGIIYLSLISCLVVHILNLNSKISIILVSLTIVSFPSVTSIYTYMFTADLFFASILLNCIGVFLIREYKYGYLYGAVTFCLGLGIYQSFICFAIALLVLSFLFDILNQRNLKQIINTGVKSLLSLILGFLLYLIILKTLLFFTGSGLTPYQDIDDMGAIGITSLPRLIAKAYRNVIFFFISRPEAFYRTPIVWNMNRLACFSGFFLLLYMIWHTQIYKNRTKFIIAFTLTFLFPFAMGFIFIMAPNSSVHLIMLFQYCLVYIAITGLLDLYLYKNRIVLKNKVIKSVCCITLLSMIVINYNNYLIANKSYFLMQLTYERMYAFYTKLSLRIEEVNDIELGNIAILGSCSPDIVYGDKKLEQELRGMIGVITPEDMLKNYIQPDFLKVYIGMPVYPPEQGIIDDISNSDEFKNMPSYPLPGSIKMIHNICVVKLSDTQNN